MNDQIMKIQVFDYCKIFHYVKTKQNRTKSPMTFRTVLFKPSHTSASPEDFVKMESALGDLGNGLWRENGIIIAKTTAWPTAHVQRYLLLR